MNLIHLDSLHTVFLGSAFLFTLLGKGTLVGLLLVLASIPVLRSVSKAIMAADRKVLVQRDARLSALREYLTSMVTIKLNGWEDTMACRVSKFRGKEIV